MVIQGLVDCVRGLEKDPSLHKCTVFDFECTHIGFPCLHTKIVDNKTFDQGDNTAKLP